MSGGIHRGTVLVADDNLFLRPRIQSDLERAGFTAIFAGSAARFHEALGACPDAILVNLAARTLPFAELVAAARAACPRAPIAGYGPHVDEALLVAARAAGCIAVVPNGAIARGAAQVVAAALGARATATLDAAATAATATTADRATTADTATTADRATTAATAATADRATTADTAATADTAQETPDAPAHAPAVVAVTEPAGRAAAAAPAPAHDAGVGGAASDPLPAGIRRGIELFNEGAYYEAHEVMEGAWRATPGDERLFYQGLIQVAVALWRVGRGDASIALTMCARGLPKLAPFRPAFLGIDVDALYRAMEWVRDQVVALGPAHLGEFDRTQFPRIQPLRTRPADNGA